MIEMQQYINISLYRDTLSSDTISIHIMLYQYIEYRDISVYRHQTVYLYIVVVHYGCEFYSSAIISCL